MKFKPAYLKITSKEFKEKIKTLYKFYEDCTLCPRKCKVNRIKGEKGFCKATAEVEISSFHAHFGEEAPLVGRGGSGTIFLTHCNLGCIFCQNYDISHLGIGDVATPLEIADMMIALQKSGCENINFVTPTHYTPGIVEAIYLAAKKGLYLPIVYNCGGYENEEVIKLLYGIVDIYMPDFKFWDTEVSKELAMASDYSQRAREALKEMHRQVGVLKISPEGIATRGLLVRHLVLPQNLAGTKEIMQFIAKEISPNTYINIMDQYTPYFKAINNPKIARRITAQEFNDAISFAHKEGITRLDKEVPKKFWLFF